MKKNLLAAGIFATTSMVMSFELLSFEPGVQESYICSIHSRMPAQQWGGGMTTNSDRGACVNTIKNSSAFQLHVEENQQKVDAGLMTAEEKTFHIPENCASIDPFY